VHARGLAGAPVAAAAPTATRSVLPDISQFSALEDLEKGIALPKDRLTDAGKVLLIFGLPMTVLAYVLLRQKEVAP